MVLVVNVLCFLKKSNYFKIISPKYFTARYPLPKNCTVCCHYISNAAFNFLKRKHEGAEFLFRSLQKAH